MLLFRSKPLFAQAIDHLVVDADQRVHLRLADGNKARRKIALVDQLRAGANQIERNEEAAHQNDSADEEQREQSFDDEEEDVLFDEHDARRDREHDVQRDEVDREFGAECHRMHSVARSLGYAVARPHPPELRNRATAQPRNQSSRHASIPYFSNRRYNAARDNPNASATREMLPS